MQISLFLIEESGLKQIKIDEVIHDIPISLFLIEESGLKLIQLGRGGIQSRFLSS